MKKLFLAAMLCIAFISNAQTLGYNDIGVLFAKETVNGTARYNAMSGAFGALGGDLSAIETNPAGAAVFLNSEFAISLNINNTETNVIIMEIINLQKTILQTYLKLVECLFLKVILDILIGVNLH